MPYKEITINGNKYKVPEEMAADLEAQNGEPTVNNGPNYDEPTPSGAFWDNPEAYVQKAIESAIDKATEKAVQTVDKKQRTKSAEERLWSKLFAKHPHLRKQQSFVEFLANKEIETLKKFEGDEGKIIDHIADVANKELAASGKTPQTEEVFAEGPAQPSTPQPDTDLDGEVKSSDAPGLGAILRNRRQSRRQARNQNAGKVAPTQQTGTGDS